MMIVIALVLLGIGSIGTLTASLLEMKYHEPTFRIMMKIFPWLFGAGGVLLGISLGF